MICLYLFVCNAVLQLSFATTSNTLEVGFIILTQENQYHEKLFREKEKEILTQAKDLDQFHIRIFKSDSIRDDTVGHWTIFPLLEKLSNFKKLNWIFFCEDVTEINLKNLQNVFQKYNSSEDVFVGHVLQDSDATIIHHFADPASLLYPHFSAGFFISLSLLHRLVSKLPVDDEYSFSIDPKYEFSKFVWDSGNGVKLQHESQFCLTKTSGNCASWIKEKFPECGASLPSDKLQVAVKTCQKFHHDRIIKKTWASEENNLSIFSDVDDKSIPTIKVDVENVARGHFSVIKKTWASEANNLSIFSDVDDKSIPTIKVDVENVARGHFSVIKKTWASEANNLSIFSDVDDKSIPTIKVDVENVARGHFSVIKKTWASEANNLSIFSDVDDKSIPTIKVDVENVARGHFSVIKKTWASEANNLSIFSDVDDKSIPTIKVDVENVARGHFSVIKKTWASEANNLSIFSDVDDKSIPTIKVDVENVARGHCEKTLLILKYYLENKITFDWLAIVDDDTIISIKRLRKLLSCYNSSDTVAIGERYGYGVAHGVGYDYITGGGGMIFSFPVAKDLYINCQCPSIDSPDDMIIGMCLKRSGIPAVHSPYFHQARPVDYTSDFLKPFKHISFHKHWNINPISVYQEWLQDSSDGGSRVEL